MIFHNMKRIFLLLALISTIVSSSHAVVFIDTDKSGSLFNIGVRAGFNTSNRSFNGKYISRYNVDSWGLGYNLGVVVDLNMRNYFSLQPGFFFERRSGEYAYVQRYIPIGGYQWEESFQLGHRYSYNFNVPVMASFKFGISERLKWVCEAGPYFQFKIKGRGDHMFVIDKKSESAGDYSVERAHVRFFDCGLKIGSGLQLDDRYSLGIHYLGGALPVWKAPYSGGHAKEWMFTLGYTL